MKRILLIALALLLATAGSVTAQNKKKVAVWETKCSDGSITTFQSTMVRGGMETAVANAPGYTGYDRTSFDNILKEHKFQRSGAVSDAEIKRMGEMAGVQYIIVPEATASGNDFYIVVKMLDVETGEYGSAYDRLCNSSASSIKEACSSLAQKLFGDVGPSNVPSTPGGRVQRGQDFTETAFGINMKMIYVEGGTFTMGCTSDQGGECDNDESPNRQTTVGSYYIGMLEVTQSQWEKVMGTNVTQQRNKANPDWPLRGTGADYPMYYVGWEEAKEFCARLSRQTGRSYSLPTEAEWEYAARGGNKHEGTKYSGGWSIDDVAWYSGNSNSSTHPCGTKRSNALGIYDMSGNVYEWCEDWYGKQYLQYDNNNPKGASTGSCRVLRGGSWYYNARYCRVAHRNGITPGGRGSYFGFRVVLH